MEFKIIRKIDRLGRIVIPKDVRVLRNLGLGDRIEITVENGTVVVRKAEVAE